LDRVARLLELLWRAARVSETMVRDKTILSGSGARIDTAMAARAKAAPKAKASRAFKKKCVLRRVK
jgi:hypothetical protein